MRNKRVRIFQNFAFFSSALLSPLKVTSKRNRDGFLAREVALAQNRNISRPKWDQRWDYMKMNFQTSNGILQETIRT